MKPFKFFFAVSVGVILFFFMAKVFLMAFMAAAFMSIIFYIFRSIRNFFYYMDWQDPRYEDQHRSSRFNRASRERFYVEPLFVEYTRRPHTRNNNSNTIHVG